MKHNTHVKNKNKKHTKTHQKFQCPNGGRISYGLVNDLVSDCGSGAEDEGHLLFLYNFTKTFSCPSLEQMPCRVGHSKCYNISQICSLRFTEENTISPCRTGDHLQNCQNFDCNMMFKCSHSYCIPWSYVCDNKWDCLGGSDETPAVSCGHNIKCLNLFKCRYSYQCVGFYQICDGLQDCIYADDEFNCELSAVKCPQTCFCHIYVLQCVNVTMNENVLGNALPYLIVSITKCHVDNEQSFKNRFLTVKYLYLKYCELSDLQSFSSTMKSSVLLDFSFNQVQHLLTACFLNMSTLETILLNNNAIKRVEYHAFINLMALQHLNLNNNFILSISSQFFCGKLHLRSLSLKNNNLTHLSKTSFKNFFVQVVQTDQFFVCCIVSEGTQCNASKQWHHSCHNLLADVIQMSTFITVFSILMISNSVFIIVQVLSYLKKTSKEKYLAKCVLVLYAALFATNLSFAFYFFIIWVANLFYSDRFVLQSTTWKSSYLCHLLLIDLLDFDMLSPSFLWFSSFSRLMVVVFPVTSKFKKYSFVCKFVAFLAVFVLTFGTIFGLIMQKYQDMLVLKFCSPFFSLTKTLILMKVLVYLVSSYQLIMIVFIIIIYFYLYETLRRSQKKVQKAVTGTRSSLSCAIIQAVTFNISHVVSWLPAIVVRLNALVQPKFSIAAVMWTMLLASSVNSVVYPVVLTVVVLRNG